MAPNAFSPENAMRTLEELENKRLLGGDGKRMKDRGTTQQFQEEKGPSAKMQANISEASDDMTNLDPKEIQVHKRLIMKVL
jgi:hypothetical protein